MTNPARTAPLSLWRIAQTFLNVLYGLFGAPDDVAARGWIARQTHKLLASWLRAGEVLLRHLLLLEAAALTQAPARTQRASRPRVRTAHEFCADAPETWRVSFRAVCAVIHTHSDRDDDRSEALAVRVCHRLAPRHPALRDAWPLAERYEALIRVFNNPAPYAARLLRRLNHAPRYVARVLAAPAEATPLIGAGTFAELCAAVGQRKRWRDTS